MSARLRAQLIWRGAAPTLVPTPEEPDFADAVAPRERAIAFLTIGSEIEHALMVQYLYAAYSLNDDQETDTRRALVKKWKAAILEVAREEMGHLATVQNLLTLIGGPLCFEREDYPIVDPGLWPFPFQLEALTKDSLAKYVLAEMPSSEVLAKLKLTDETNAIKQRLQVNDGLSVHRVGALYQQILNLFTAGPMIQGPQPGGATPAPFVATVDIQADSLPYQASAGAWALGYQDILVETASDRTSALAALQKISAQGEGPISTTDANAKQEYEGSHFRRFLDIYREFPEPADWTPARPVATNPSTRPGVVDPARCIDGIASPWAALANLRYRMLLLYLEHSFCIDSGHGSQTRSPRGALVSWAFGEMYNLRSLSEILMRLPLAPGSALMAGPPFEMPYTLSLPTRAVNRWRAHRDLVMAAGALIDQLLVPGQPQAAYLRALRAADQTALDQINVLIGA